MCFIILHQKLVMFHPWNNLFRWKNVYKRFRMFHENYNVSRENGNEIFDLASSDFKSVSQIIMRTFQWSGIVKHIFWRFNLCQCDSLRFYMKNGETKIRIFMFHAMPTNFCFIEKLIWNGFVSKNVSRYFFLVSSSSSWNKFLFSYVSLSFVHASKMK